jgi:hypothetical protein
MRTFSAKSEPAEATTSAKVAAARRAHVGQGHEPNALLNLQRTLGNRALSRLLRPRSIQSDGVPLPDTTRAELQPRVAFDLNRVRIHTDQSASRDAADLQAAAFTYGTHIVFGADRFSPQSASGEFLLLHELTHVAQQLGRDPRAGSDTPRLTQIPSAEHEADRQASSGRIGGTVPHTPGIMLHPAEKVLKFAAKYLAKKASKTVSKHVGRHARRIGGRAIHSVFKQPKKIKTMLEATVREATELAAKHATEPATRALSEGGLQVVRQTTATPGKFRWVVQKTFAAEIGTAGERVLRIVIDQTGRIVTAFPTDRLMALGLGVGAVNIFGERSAAAAEKAHAHAARDAAKEEEISWWEFVPIIGDLWGGELNAGEDALLQRDRELDKDIREAIAAVEEEEQRSLNPEERKVVEETFRAAIAASLLSVDEGEP